MTTEHTSIAFFDTQRQTEMAIMHFEKMRFDMKKLSVIGSNFCTTENIIGFHNVGNVREWATFGAFWGGFWGLLFEASAIHLQEIGSAIVAGPLAKQFGNTSSNRIEDLNEALSKIGISTHNISKYGSRIKAGKFMLVAHGSFSGLSPNQANFPGCIFNEMQTAPVFSSIQKL